MSFDVVSTWMWEKCEKLIEQERQIDSSIRIYHKTHFVISIKANTFTALSQENDYENGFW